MENITDKIQANHPLASLTTFKIGGSAEYFFELTNKEDVSEIFAWAKDKKLNITILGGGSNVLINDQGVKGLVVLMKNEKIKVSGKRLEVEAGVTLNNALSLALSNNLSGLEWSKGIPRATIGGAIRGNAEAFVNSMSDIVETVLVYDRSKNIFENYSNKMCDFSYRQSIFKKNLDLLIWSAVFKMTEKEKKEIEEKAINSLNFRIEKYPQLPSAGSVFMNLDPKIVEKSNKKLYDEILCHKIGRLGTISVGLVIDMLGLKGKTIGGAKISLEHANFIVNTGNATADDVAQLISLIKTTARDKFGIALHEEIQYIGFI
ncbi:MAG: UDP-N-acetylenolpyruvoylglucosamine reductase [Candidatus Falkowbacteria bacterium GW2011_GWC2_38_22]|uniref:UDP-N-acetylenolpyruvoylglucosamine reductase n=1 Tax=Candidatus Falkowbacteria bacterium GW2011_GWE1_38_31 TaxID=1618638 RepID=A0A0G0K5G8_9BACT|nr:MAG: UDP-N-acetylenolpyruvoylglucosamine reductase [Candidatus Falkowbacteria bacterium GW2011_GWF2_38_1205]KKQ62018.1 MAG: UDP-N-acetylenolpyruvoylglucosamine reductase [Candidatus Falkowbacteria bacterium GW2011_GWC2_38_22]KKQ63820.1 MAG: UDP-N-acetylenolpyruvoylglucosamine reductase [Candidatus Falkowbacteria bacterium GW2011_GWF1_38_22]KKQ66077.1 MAG: UDP-N-acetylenolpyruvoylglucosamine reductase [Candidatus Falkowbacteria bacterium GW2011_GWE2_38_254]KKQ70680.1 MAG: UDP-N-acetylenolpyru